MAAASLTPIDFEEEAGGEEATELHVEPSFGDSALQWTNDFNYDDHSVLLSVGQEIFKVIREVLCDSKLNEL
jgi:hypothetical protein